MIPVTIQVRRDYFTFSAAHFATLEHGGHEAMHGHNYEVVLTLSGVVDDRGVLAEFAPLKALVRTATAALNHKVLVAAASTALRVETVAGQVQVTSGTKLYSLPEADVVLLPLQNTTVECLAAHIAATLLPEVVKLASGVAWIEVTVCESPGQSASIRLNAHE